MISEMMPSISIPAIVLADPSSRSGPILDLERYLLDQKHLEQTKIQLLKQRQQYIGEQVEKQLANKQKKL